jgi:hypothetical protein
LIRLLGGISQGGVVAMHTHRYGGLVSGDISRGGVMAKEMGEWWNNLVGMVA